ncbi:type VI secretion system lipoprotein TssJ [Oceanicella sp. SM1341]|uniref:type VI secretion system lipoprotein TssJ n=1 Tax=Oceanicella sp. SM1341 TaxID=1548889 RepID=UPI000E4A6194|nr:type VI secretion system lipoprotein TssJ [Oceanicella sp. SM1341]
MTMTIRLRPCAVALGSGLALGLAACAAPEPPPPTTVQLTLAGAADMNGARPARVKVYYLRSAAGFGGADFFALFDAPEATLGPDLVSVSEHLLAPGATLADTRSFAPGAPAPAALGVVVGFREVDGPGWSAVAPLSPGSANALRATVSADTVSLAGQPEE